MTDFSDKYKRFDAADYLEGLDDVARYLEIAVEDSDEGPLALPSALSTVARSRTLAELARRIGTTDEVLVGELATADPSFATIQKVTNALGMRLELHTVA